MVSGHTSRNSADNLLFVFLVPTKKIKRRGPGDTRILPNGFRNSLYNRKVIEKT